jgi:dehydrogenase/reductase SDR family protein 4
LAVDGANFVISSRKQKKFDEALTKLKSEGLSVSGMGCHAGAKECRIRLIEKTSADFGGFEILISNVAVNTDSGCQMKVSRLQRVTLSVI